MPAHRWLITALAVLTVAMASATADAKRTKSPEGADPSPSQGRIAKDADRIDLRLVGVGANHVPRVFAGIGRVAFVTSGAVAGTKDATAIGAPWDLALAGILAELGLVWRREGTVLWLATEATVAGVPELDSATAISQLGAEDLEIYAFGAFLPARSGCRRGPVAAFRPG